MTRLLDVSPDAAKAYFLKGSSYFNNDFPEYISFEPILAGVADILDGKELSKIRRNNPAGYSDVNYSFTANKDGRFSWRPLELIHPAIYVSLVNLICAPDNWKEVTSRLKSFEGGAVKFALREIFNA